MERQQIKSPEQLFKLLAQQRDTGGSYKFRNCDFRFDVNLVQEVRGLFIEDCTFYGTALFNPVQPNDWYFHNVEFKKRFDLSEISFKKKVRFHRCTFDCVTNFENTKFHELADFYGSTFTESVVFYKTDFYKRAVFSGVKFKKNVLFTYSLIEDHLILRGATFHKGLDLSLIILSGSINLYNITIGQFESISDIENEDEYLDAVAYSSKIPDKNKRETFRLMKKQLQNQGNSIDALKMAALEKQAYQDQLKSESKRKVGKWNRRVQNRFILWLGKWSNAHGESWLRGTLFTFLVGLGFFTIMFFSTECWCRTNFLEYYLTFMLPTHNIDFMNEFNPYLWFYPLDFLGRIFVAFGIYQTVVAFRKFHSK